MFSDLDISKLGNLPLEQLLIALAAFAALTTVLLVWYALIDKDPTQGRIRDLAQRREAFLADAIYTPTTHAGRQKLTQSQVITGLGERVKRFQGDKVALVKTRLAQAGRRSSEALNVYFAAKFFLPLAMAPTVPGVIGLYTKTDHTTFQIALFALLGLAIGYFVPDIFVHNQRTKRQQQLQRALPDALDLLVICAEAGLSLDMALKRVAAEFGKRSPEIADELALTSVELSFLPERSLALANLAQRTGLQSVRSVVATLAQTEKYGTPLAQGLQVLSKESRTERLLKAEEKASRLPATMTVPLILFVLPPLFVVILGPGILNVIDSLLPAMKV